MYGTVFDADACLWFRDEEILQSSESYRNRLLSDVSLVFRPDETGTQSTSSYIVRRNETWSSVYIVIGIIAVMTMNLRYDTIR